MHWWLSRTTPGQTLFPGELTSFNASPHWQVPSSYVQVVYPQGFAQVPSWNTFPVSLHDLLVVIVTGTFFFLSLKA